MMNDTVTLPLGFRFEPTNEELIRGYLIPNVMGIPLPWNGISEVVVYGDNASPWDIFDDSSPYWSVKGEGGNKKMYVFTRLTKSSSTSSRVSRRAGCGTWVAKTGPKSIIDSTTGDVIGCVRMLSFQQSEKPEKWTMHEFSLIANVDMVLCKITKCFDNHGPTVPPPRPHFSFPDHHPLVPVPAVVGEASDDDIDIDSILLGLDFNVDDFLNL